MFLLRDYFSIWHLDRAGEESTEEYRPSDLMRLIGTGELHPTDWVRHVRTHRYALVGEVLYAQRLIDRETFDSWVPKPTGVESA